MKKQLKRLVALGMVAVMSLSVSMVSFADWKQDDKGWWYENTDGSFVKDSWQEVNGQWYAFDDDGYMLADEWTYYNNNWYKLATSGAMEVNKVYDTGIVNEAGQWFTDCNFVNAHIWDDTEKAYWDKLIEKYGLTDKNYTDNGDGTYTMVHNYDDGAVIPEVVNVMVEKGLYQFSEFSWAWKTGNGVATVTLSNTHGY